MRTFTSPHKIILQTLRDNTLKKLIIIYKRKYIIFIVQPTIKKCEDFTSPHYVLKQLKKLFFIVQKTLLVFDDATTSVILYSSKKKKRIKKNCEETNPHSIKLIKIKYMFRKIKNIPITQHYISLLCATHIFFSFLIISCKLLYYTYVRICTNMYKYVGISTNIYKSVEISTNV